jgi:hypothetical protein
MATAVRPWPVSQLEFNVEHHKELLVEGVFGTKQLQLLQTCHP